VSRVQVLGLACLVGGLLFAGLNSTEDVGLTPPASVSLILGVALLLGLMGGPLGLLASGGAGEGWAGRAGLIGAVISLLGLVSYFIGVLYTGLVDPEMGIFYAIGALLSGVGMLPLGIAVIAARRLRGWRRLAPLLVGVYYALMIPIQIVFFIGPRGAPSPTLLAIWGLAWALLGYAIFTSASAIESDSAAQARAAA
jgi:hypothetical protein